MSLLLQNGLPAERQRGLVFCERFDSVEAFYKNGGTIATGTPIFGKNNCYFDGSSRLTYSMGNPTIKGSSAATLMAVLKYSALTSGPKLAAEIGDGGGLYLGVHNGTTNIGFGIYAIGDISAGIIPNINQSYHLTITYAGGAGGAISCFVDGINVANGNATCAVATSNVYMGQAHVGAYSFIGFVSNVQIFNKQLSAEEVLAYSKMKGGY